MLAHPCRIAMALGVVYFASVAAAQSGETTGRALNTISSASPFEGAWREVEVNVTLRNGTVLTLHPEASIYVFSGYHYAMMATAGASPRPLFKEHQPTDAEKIVAYDTFWGHSGSFEINGDTVVLHALVAKHPNLMGGGSQKVQLKVMGDTLWMTGKASDYLHRYPTGFAPDPRGYTERVQLVRMR